MDYHEQQLSLNQHMGAFNIERVHDERSQALRRESSLPVRVLNEDFGENLSCRMTYPGLTQGTI